MWFFRSARLNCESILSKQFLFTCSRILDGRKNTHVFLSVIHVHGPWSSAGSCPVLPFVYTLSLFIFSIHTTILCFSGGCFVLRSASRQNQAAIGEEGELQGSVTSITQMMLRPPAQPGSHSSGGKSESGGAAAGVARAGDDSESTTSPDQQQKVKQKVEDTL